jgi:Sodium/hydrogen exchanger family.
MIDFSSNTWIFASLSLLTVAIIGKLISGVFLTNLTWISRLGIGLAMIPRGEVGLIFAKVGKNAEIIDETLFAALILVIAVTTIIAPACLRLVHGKTAA